MHSPWQVIVVRAWRLGPRQIVRLTLSGGPGSPVHTRYAASSGAAAEVLRAWLDDPMASEECTTPEAGGADDDT